MAITIRQVAAKAGFSTATVSMALNRHRKAKCEIPDKTVKTIIDIAKTMGYRPSAIASSLRSNQTHIIGGLVAALRGDFYERILSGISKAVCPTFTPILGIHGYDPESERQQIEGFIRRRIDGVIAAYSGAAENITYYSELSKYDIPLVLIDRGIPGMNVPVVRSDHFNQTYRAVESLKNLGHRKIIYVDNGRQLESYEMRKQGFVTAMGDFGLEKFIHVISTPEFENQLGSYARHILDLFATKLSWATAMVIQNDWLAYEVLTECKARGIKVPVDLSIMGLDDCYLSSLNEIGLSTVAQKPEVIGLHAAQLLLSIIQGNMWDGNPVIIPTEVKMRQTTGNPKSSE